MRDFDGDESPQLVVVGEVNEAEAALAKHPFHPVATDVLRKCGR